MKKKRQNDVMSIPRRRYVSLNGYTRSFRVVLLCLFLPYLMLYIIDYQRGILSYQIRQLPCRARGAPAHNLFLNLPFHIDSFVNGNVFSFRLSTGWCVQYKVTKLDALIKCVS